MRNLLWFLGVLSCIAVAARFHPQPHSPQIAATPLREVSIFWREWNGKDLRLQFVAEPTGCRFGRAGQPMIPIRGSRDGVVFLELYPALRAEVERALEEPCRGVKTSELTLREGSKTWTIEVGTYAGPSQARILDILASSSRVRDMRQVTL